MTDHAPNCTHSCDFNDNPQGLHDPACTHSCDTDRADKESDTEARERHASLLRAFGLPVYVMQSPAATSEESSDD